jgi:hypothetical protein
MTHLAGHEQRREKREDRDRGVGVGLGCLLLGRALDLRLGEGAQADIGDQPEGGDDYREDDELSDVGD